MDNTAGPSSDSQSSDGDGAPTECSYAEGFPVADDNYYDDSGGNDGSGTSQDSPADPFDPDGDDPLRNRDISEKQISQRIMKEFARVDLTGLTPLQIARIITSKILQVTDVAVADSLPNTMDTMIREQVLNHGLSAEAGDASQEIAAGIAAFPFTRTVALLHHVCIRPAAFDVPGAYSICVRGVNTLKLILDPPFVGQLGGEVVNILQRTWDVAVLLLGATRTRAHMVGDNYLQLEDLRFMHAAHYRAEVQRVMDSDLNNFSVCRKTLADLTREEMPPFVHPGRLLETLKGPDTGDEQFHINCTPDFCKPDVDGVQRPKYHRPECFGQCELVIPPKASIRSFQSILLGQRRMPAVRISAYKTQDKKKWWIPASQNTMTVSHLWKDGITGTRDGGMNECLHRYFSEVAEENGLDSYWIDCSTIPEDPRQRRMMIGLINSTYHTARFTLCMDDRVAKMDFPDDETAEAQQHQDEKALLAVITSFWHRRAWTLLEGHKAADIRFYRERGKHIVLRKALERVLVDEETKTPLWIRACLAEFEAYMSESLIPEAAGMLLATRAASREGDSELIWRLLTQPFTTQHASKAVSPHPFHYSDTVDLAFICSNAERSHKVGLCWMPSKTKVTAWARQAYGGAKAEIVRTTNVHLRSQWYVKHGLYQDIETIDFESAASNKASATHLRWKIESRTFDFLLALPVLRGDQERPEECDKVIILTRPAHKHFTFGHDVFDRLWHWETMVQLKAKIQLSGENLMTLNVGFDPGSAPISNGHTMMALPAAAMASDPTCAQAKRGFWLPSDFLSRVPRVLAWGVSVALFARTVAAAGASSSSGSSETADLSLFLHPPENIPQILVEWCSLVPLTIYLAGARTDFDLAGEVSLRGRLSVSVIPKVGAFGAVARVLRQGEVFFDSANAAGETLKVFDVQHGSVFQCYNCAAAAQVAEAAFKGYGGDTAITEDDLVNWITKHRDQLENELMVARFDDGKPGDGEHWYGFEEQRDSRKIYGRRQVLNVIHIRRAAGSVQEPRSGIARKIYVIPDFIRRGKIASYYGELILLVGIVVVLVGAGCPGCAALLLIGAVSRFFVHHTTIGRPPQYLMNRTDYNEGCMLVAVHDNAAVWTLYHGERGLIDALLNKPMVNHRRPSMIDGVVHAWFRFAEILQVVAMTFVAGHKGWDGLVLLILILAVWGFSTFYGYNKHAANWLKAEGFETTAFRCEFPGRTELVSAVQLLSTRKRTIWMDSIISPCDRRTVLLQKLGAIDCTPEQCKEDFEALVYRDRLWVISSWMQAVAGATMIRQEIDDRLRRKVVSDQKVTVNGKLDV